MTGASNCFTQQLQDQQDLSEQALARQTAQLQVGTPAKHLLRDALPPQGNLGTGWRTVVCLKGC